MHRLTPFVLLGLAGCATTTPVPAHVAQQFTGRPYDIRDEGGRITGSVCGVNVDYSVAMSGQGAALNGFMGTSRTAYIEVKPTASGRHIVGTTGARTGSGEIDLYVDDSAIKGRAGLRNFDLRARGDVFVGRMTALNTVGAVPAMVAGRTELGHMPGADMGAILPALLNCSAPTGNTGVRGSMIVGFGGPAGYDTREANELR